MQREIKFRAWDKKRKKFINELAQNAPHESHYGLSLTGKLVQFGISMDFQQYWEWEEKPDEVILMQYTGLEDKNRKEIYEGDIVEFFYATGGSYPNHTGEKIVASVFWGQRKCEEQECGIYHTWLIKTKDNVLNFSSLENFDKKWIKIIGNIYENPELLT